MKMFPGRQDRPLNMNMNGVKLEQCGSKFKEKSIKFLGILVDDKLDWGEHINS